jgi:hypothetical protein
MTKLNLQESSKIVGGDRDARFEKQYYKCMNGSIRACNRALRILDRM